MRLNSKNKSTDTSSSPSVKIVHLKNASYSKSSQSQKNVKISLNDSSITIQTARNPNNDSKFLQSTDLKSIDSPKDFSIDNDFAIRFKSMGDPGTRTDSPSITITNYEHSNTQKEDLDLFISAESNSFLHPIQETQNDLLDRFGSGRGTPNEFSGNEYSPRKEKKMSLFKTRNDEELSQSQRSLYSHMTNTQLNEDIQENDLRVSTEKRSSTLKDREVSNETPLDMDSQVFTKDEDDTANS